ncbi:MAG TPA: dienelactone hydrolase family protein, partial [Stellaceae bacterium]|nr:dienelactone hydrolase family protein [Stellaceae bacterium]
AARTWPQGTGKVGVVGFCLGGQLAVKAGLKARADAVVSFYGVQLGQSLDEIADLGCPAQFHYGDADQHVPAETRAAIDGLAKRRANITSFTYPGAVHAFFNSFRPQGFDPAAYDQSRARMLAMLQEALR